MDHVRHTYTERVGEREGEIADVCSEFPPVDYTTTGEGLGSHIVSLFADIPHENEATKSTESL